MRDSNRAIGKSRRSRDREVVPQTPDSEQDSAEDEPDQDQDTDEEQGSEDEQDLEPAVVPIDTDE